MEQTNANAINWCNRLIMRCEDSANDFRAAAEIAIADSLKEFLMDESESRLFMVDALKGEVVSLGSEPNEGGSLSATLHRGWTRIKEIAGGYSDSDVLDECLESENKTLDLYREALADVSVPTLTRELFQRQHDEVLENQGVLKTTRNGPLIEV